MTEPTQQAIIAWMESMGFKWDKETDLYSKNDSLWATSMQATFFYQARETAIKEERDRWTSASMERIAKYDVTGIPPETQVLIDKAVAEALREQIMQDFLSLNIKFDGCVDEADLINWREGQIDLAPPNQEGAE